MTTVKADKTPAFEQPRLRDTQFVTFMRIVAAVTLVVGAAEIGLSYVTGARHLFEIGAVVLGACLVAYMASLRARAGHLRSGVLIWFIGSPLVLGWAPAAITGLTSLVMAGILVNLLLFVAFVRPRLQTGVMIVTALYMAVVAAIEAWLPRPRPSVFQSLPWLLPALYPTILLIIAYLINQFGQSLLTALESAQAYAKELEKSQATLTQQTEDLKATTAELVTRTGELERLNLEVRNASQQAERRATQLAASAQVARAASQVRDLDQLLTQVTQLISQTFGYYHVGVFIVDELGRFAVLRAANSEGGQRMLARGHKLAVGEQGLVGYVTGSGQPRIALDVGADAVHFDNPDLPQTRSEIALPLRVGDQIFGALDVQSTQEAAFTEEDISVLSALADQVAIAIENARLFAQTQAALRAAEETQARYLRQEWERLLPTLSSVHHEYRVSGVSSVGDAPLPEIEQALRQGAPVALAPAPHDGAYTGALAVPIKLRDQIIGVIDLHETDHPREWTEEDVALVTEIADQTAQALENVRLFERIQQQARRERMVSTIAARVRAAPDVEGVLKATVHEIRRALGVSHGVIRLKTGETQSIADAAG